MTNPQFSYESVASEEAFPTAMMNKFIIATVEAWIKEGIIEPSSYAVTLLDLEGGELDVVYSFQATLEGADNDGAYYYANTMGKAEVCLVAGVDSDVAIATMPEVVLGCDHAFPHPGAIVRDGDCTTTSGFKADEDVLLSVLAYAYLRMHAARAGREAIAATTKGDGRFVGSRP